MCPGLAAPGRTQPQSRQPWNDTRIIIFTEYDDTKRYLHQQLSAAIDRPTGPTSGLPSSTARRPDEREEIKQAFNADPGKHPLRILIATDAAREGLNLQAHCWNLFHFDVPWNPSRMEQRNGRIDRKLQPSAEVFCHYFVYKQRPEDRILVGPGPQDRDDQEGAGQPGPGDRRPPAPTRSSRAFAATRSTPSNTKSKRPTSIPTGGRPSRKSWKRHASGRMP